MSIDTHLSKNVNEYWLCPLCGHALIYEEDPVKLYCPTYTNVHEGVRWCHYDHQPNDKNEVRYIAIIPPFYVQWNSTTNELVIKTFGNYRDDWRQTKDLLTKENVSHDELLNTYERLKKLKVFT